MSSNSHEPDVAANANLSDRLNAARLVADGAVARAEYHETIGSTQIRAQEIARADDCGALPLVVVAEEQTAGRGRGTNQWWTGRGSLAFSLLFDPVAWSLPRQPLPGRSLAVGVAIVETVRPLIAGPAVGLHWPNDVFVGGKKLAGVLIDVLHHGRHVVGIGLNVNNTFEAAPSDVRCRATSLVELTGRTFDRTALLCKLIRNIEMAVRESSVGDEFGSRFGALCLQVGKVLTVDVGGRRVSGRCTGIGPDGALMLETDQGPQTIYSGILV